MLKLGAELGKSDSGEVGKDSTTNKRVEHDSPPGERSASLGNVENTEGNLCEDERAEDQTDPDILEACLTEHLSKAGETILDAVSQRNGPDTRSPNARNDHDSTGNKNTLGGTVDVAEEESVSVVGLPGREEHRQAGAERGDDTGCRGSEAHGGGSEQTSQRAVERVDTVVEKFTEAA
ncbi:hypothetical protein HG531_008789 [Fusarium graminearum]|nr:hypothetical protein HG531_008789 [Fusarium graminearum]